MLQTYSPINSLPFPFHNEYLREPLNFISQSSLIPQSQTNEVKKPLYQMDNDVIYPALYSSQTNTTIDYNTQDNLLFSCLMNYYKNEENMAKFLRIIQGNSPVSLRVIDWFVTNYAKKYDTCILNPEKKNIKEQRFEVYQQYKRELKANNKSKFDPFCRRDRKKMHYQDDMYVETTLGQLNFLKWVLDNKIVEYIEDHFQVINNDMKTRGSMSKRKEMIEKNGANSATKTRKKREELSVSATKNIKKEDIDIVLSFR